MPLAARQWQMRAFKAAGICDPLLFEQCVHAIGDIQLEVTDLRTCGDGEQERAIIAALFEAVRRPFDYGRPSMCRLHHLRLAGTRHVLMLSVPQVAADVASTPILWRDLFRCFAPGRTDPRSPSMTPQLGDFAVWQSEQALTDYFHNDVEHWHDRWAAFGADRLTPVDLKFINPLAAPGTAQMCAARANTDERLTTDIYESAVRLGVAPVVLFLSAFATFLREASGRSRFSWWMSFPNRRRSGTDGMVGYIENAHLLGLDMANLSSPIAIIEACRQLIVGGQLHQQLPMPLFSWWNGRDPGSKDSRVTFDWRTEDQQLRDGLDVEVDFSGGPVGGGVVPGGFFLRIIQRPNEFALSIVFWAGPTSQDAVDDVLHRYINEVALVTRST